MTKKKNTDHAAPRKNVDEAKAAIAKLSDVI
jgi:hypothetical protein